MLSVLLVAAGAAIGALARFGLTRILPLTPATFATNIISCLLLGLFAGWYAKQENPKAALHLFFATGICGGMGTFSTWILDIVNKFKNGDSVTGILVMSLPILCGVVALVIGYAIANRS